MVHLCNWLVHYIEHAFRGVALGAGMTIYEAAYHADYGFSPTELELAKTAERIDWRRVPVDDLFSRDDAILFLDPLGRRFYSPAIMRALLTEGPRDGMMCEAFFFKLDQCVHQKKVRDISFADLYDSSQRAAFVRFCKYAAHNAPREFGTHEPLRLLKGIRRLGPPRRTRRTIR